MTERDFCYWLQGFFEILGASNPGGDFPVLNGKQVDMIKNHLNLVFVHSIDTPDPTGKLQAAHDGKKLLTEDDKKELEKRIENVKWSRPPTARC